MPTSKELFDAVIADTHYSDLSPAASIDYGFARARDDAHRQALYSVYQLLVIHKGVTDKDLHNHFLLNDLNDFVKSFFDDGGFFTVDGVKYWSQSYKILRDKGGILNYFIEGGEGDD